MGGGERKGDISSQIFDRRDGLWNHPPIFWKVNNILSWQINRFCSKIGWLLMIVSEILSKISPKIQNFGQSGPKNYVFYPSPALNLRLKVFTKLYDFSCKNTELSSFLVGHIPLRHPLCVQVRNWRWRTTKYRRRIYAPASKEEQRLLVLLVSYWVSP